MFAAAGGINAALDFWWGPVNNAHYVITRPSSFSVLSLPSQMCFPFKLEQSVASITEESLSGICDTL
jgi:hypothetical protein